MGARPENSVEAVDRERLDQLAGAVAAIARQVEVLDRQVAELADAVESIAADGGTPPEALPAAGSAEAGSKPGTGDPTLEILVSPIPELALVALVETTVRGLNGIRNLASVERSEDSVRFVVQPDPDADLIAEMKQAMPVPVTVLDSDEGSVSLSLQWN